MLDMWNDLTNKQKATLVASLVAMVVAALDLTLSDNIVTAWYAFLEVLFNE